MKDYKQQSTPAKILKAAQTVFLEKGFEGGSINDIADKAKINKSLIYHHFESKENLWRVVKANLIEKQAGQRWEEISFSKDSFRQFLRDFVTFRFNLYDKNPEIARLIAWQRLEKSDEAIAGPTSPSMENLNDYIEHFQQSGEVRPHLDPEMVMYFIMTSASMPFMDNPDFMKGKTVRKAKQAYLDMLIEGLYNAFATHKAPEKWLIKG